MENKEILIQQNIDNEIKESFLSYAMSVITDRALPDVRDGLKPVHRRIIYDMDQLLKLKSSGKYVKSARIVGDVIGKLHAHGDTSVYEAACRLTLDYVMRYPLIDGQGSFGSTDGDGAAAMRYTEMRPTKLMELITKDVKKDTVNMIPTFDEESLEPEVMPGLFPNLLCNPISGIAVSESCSFLPHNLTEVCNGIIAYMNNNNITLEEMMNIIPGPDFPLGGVITNERDIYTAYENGKTLSTLRLQGDYKIEDNKIIFTSIPFGANRSKIKEQINKNINLFDGLVSDFNDETNRDGISIVFELEDINNTDKLLEIIFKETDLEKTCPINNVCLVNGAPKQLGLLEIIKEYVSHQNNIIINSSIFDRKKALARIHILEGLIKAIDDIDNVIELIRGSKNKSYARQSLIEYLIIDDIQANAILDMTLARLTKIDEEELNKELELKKNEVEEYNRLINDSEYRKDNLINKIIKMRDNFGDARRTKLDNIIIDKKCKTKKVEIPDTPTTVCLVKNKNGNASLKIVKRNLVGSCISTKLNSSIVIFTNLGMAYKIPVVKIGESSLNLKTMFNMKPNEVILTIVDIYDKGQVYQTTKFGFIKKTDISEFNSTRAVQSIKLKENDEVISIECGKDYEYLYQKTNNYELSFSINDISITGRIGIGTKGIKLKDNDFLIEAKFLKEKPELLGKKGQIGKKHKK